MSVRTVAISRYIKHDENRNTFRTTQLNEVTTIEGVHFALITIEKDKLKDLRAYQDSSFKNGVVALYDQTEE